MKPKNTSKWLAASTAMLLSLGLLVPYLARATSNATATRLAGANRYATARAIAEATFTGGAANAVVASGTNFPDALAANYLQGAKSGPVILTDPTNLANSPDTRTALFNLKVKNVTIVGGTDAVSTAVENELKTTNSTAGAGGTLVVDRIAGADRYETARKIAEAAGGPGGANVGLSNGKKTAIIATGAQFPDALAAGPAGYGKKFPIILTTTASLHPQATAALQSLGIQNVVIMGGVNAVSQATEDAIKAINSITVERRFAGVDRQDTARQFADYAITTFGFGNTHVNLARGDNFPDALAGGPHAANDQSIDVILLTDGFVAGQNHLGSQATSFLSGRASTISSIHIFGGNQAISDATVNAAIVAVGGTPSPTPTGTPSPSPTGGVGSGAQARTAGPDLVSATITEFAVGNGIPNRVRFLFDSDVNNILDATAFSVQGYDSSTEFASTAASIDGANIRAVVVSFGDLVDLRQFTIGTVDGGAVEGPGGQDNILASRLLSGSLFAPGTGQTAAPDLINATSDAGTNEITYIFDQQIDTTGSGAFDFSFYDSSGTQRFGDVITSPTALSDRITVQFTGSGDNVVNAVRFAVDNGAVVSPAPSSLSNPEGHKGATTNAPDLTGVTRVAGVPNQFDFVFDAAVQDPPIAGFLTGFNVYTDGGTLFEADGFTRPNSSTVRASFSTLNQNNANKIVLATVEDGATESVATPNVDNTIGAFPVAGGINALPGFTDGPDLISATFDAAGNQVTFVFDDNIDDTGLTPVAANFFVFSAGGVATAGTGTPIVSGKTVVVSFPAGAVASAAGAGVESATGIQPPLGGGNAAFDFSGNPNSPGSVGGGPAPAA